jgi:hypothetical protein
MISKPVKQWAAVNTSFGATNVPLQTIVPLAPVSGTTDSWMVSTAPFVRDFTSAPTGDDALAQPLASTKPLRNTADQWLRLPGLFMKVSCLKAWRITLVTELARRSYKHS